MGHRRERCGGTGPSELLHVVEQRRIGAERRECFEKHDPLPVFSKDARGKLLEMAVLADQTRRGLRTDAWQSRVAVGGVADEGKKIRDERRTDPELRGDPRLIANLAAPA